VCLIGVGRPKYKQMIGSSTGVLNVNESYSVSLEDPSSSAPELERSHSATNNFVNKYILLNPGPEYEIDGQDLCFYVSLVKEENYIWKEARTKICNQNASYF
jgi:hypothetical protein